MQKNQTLTFLILFLFCINLKAQNERYIDEIFTEVNVETGIAYAVNYTVITGMPEPETLVFDFYSAVGDMRTDRPIVILWTGGNFLPNPVNGTTLGTQTDYANVELARRLAKRGYVVAIPTYRKGWNPLGDYHAGRSTFINAIYRCVQDSRAMVRFLNKSIDTEQNPYGICGNKVVHWGVGTGGTIAVSSITLDAYEDLVSDKFIGPDITGDGIPDHYVDIEISSDLSGSTETVLNLVNHLGYDDEAALCVSMGGALVDTTFLDASDPPMICFATPSDPQVPYNTDITLLNGPSIFYEITGSYDIIERAQELGINDVFSSVEGDPFSLAAAYTSSHPNSPDVTVSEAEGLNGLMPFNRPIWENPFSGLPSSEYAPWDYWDAEYWSTIAHPFCPSSSSIEECNSHIVNGIYNQDMSMEKANIYLDSVMGYVLPRAYLALDLFQNFNCTTATNDLVDAKTIDFKVIPNPATSDLIISVNLDISILGATLYSLQGQEILSFKDVNANELKIARKGISAGVYLIRIRMENGISTKKVVFN